MNVIITFQETDRDTVLKVLNEEKIKIKRNSSFEYFSPQIEFEIDNSFSKSLLKVILTKINSLSVDSVEIVRCL